jgi:hypothetical protein
MIVSDPFEPHLRHGVDMDGSRSVSPQTGKALDPFNNPVTWDCLRMFEGKIWRRKNPHFGMMHMRKT